MVFTKAKPWLCYRFGIEAGRVSLDARFEGGPSERVGVGGVASLSDVGAGVGHRRRRDLLGGAAGRVGAHRTALLALERRRLLRLLARLHQWLGLFVGWLVGFFYVTLYVTPVEFYLVDSVSP